MREITQQNKMYGTQMKQNLQTVLRWWKITMCTLYTLRFDCTLCFLEFLNLFASKKFIYWVWSSCTWISVWWMCQLISFIQSDLFLFWFKSIFLLRIINLHALIKVEYEISFILWQDTSFTVFVHFVYLVLQNSGYWYMVSWKTKCTRASYFRFLWITLSTSRCFTTRSRWRCIIELRHGYF